MKSRPKNPKRIRPVDVSDLKQIVAWLEAEDLYEIEIEETGRHIRIVMAGRAPASATPSKDDGTGEAVVAHSVGIFLVALPGRRSNFVQCGDSVKAGSVMAILKIGRLLTPVVAPIDGTVVRALVEPQTMVEFGTKLFEIKPLKDGIQVGRRVPRAREQMTSER
jgi:acetyl-CoA carboxylase biotin carboxyl carrier protein